MSFSFHHAEKVHLAARQQPPLAVSLSRAGTGTPLALRAAQLRGVELGVTPGGYQSSSTSYPFIPDPLVGASLPSARPSPGRGSAQVTLGPQSLPQCPSQAVLSPWALPCQQHLAVLPQRGWAYAVGEALSKQGGDRRTRSGAGADRCELVCGGQSKAEGMRLEPCHTWAVNVMATRHRDRDVRGQAALLGGTPECRRNRDSSSQGPGQGCRSLPL